MLSTKAKQKKMSNKLIKFYGTNRDEGLGAFEKEDPRYYTEFIIHELGHLYLLGVEPEEGMGLENPSRAACELDEITSSAISDLNEIRTIAVELNVMTDMNLVDLEDCQTILMSGKRACHLSYTYSQFVQLVTRARKTIKVINVSKDVRSLVEEIVNERS